MTQPPPPPPFDSETQEMTRARETFIGPYRNELKIGEGGMGVVYKCFDPKLKRFVAVKVLKDKYARESRHHDRLQREAQSIAAVSHLNIAQIYAIETSGDGPPYLVMEYVDGSSAEILLKGGGDVPCERVLTIARGVAAGLRAAFRKKIVHRDIKPSNILIGGDGTVKIVDFGLAKEIEGAKSLTDEGVVLGTPHYISPEQGKGRPVDHRSDMYSLGATLYHLLAGRPPFDGDTQVAVIVAHINETPKPPHEVRRDVPESLSFVIGRMMAKDPAQRYETYDLLIDDLDRLARGEPIHPSTAAQGRVTYRPQKQMTPVFSWALAAVATVAAALAIAVAVRSGGGSLSPGDPRRLGSWYMPAIDGAECLDLRFEELPAGLTRTEAIHSLFLFAKRDEPQIAIESRRLLLKETQSPVALQFGFSRIDEVGLVGLKAEGAEDISIAIVDPDDARRRSLLFVVSGGQPRSGGRAGAPPTAEPIRATRNGEKVGFGAPLPRAPLLEAGAFDLAIRFKVEGTATRVHFDIHRASVIAESLLAIGSGSDGSGGPEGSRGPRLPGTDWNSGVLLIWAPSPLGRGSIAFDRLRIVGSVDRRRDVRKIPWDVRPQRGTEIGSAEHGSFDRR